MASSQNGNALAFTGTPLPSDRRFCQASCFDVTYEGQYTVSEFDSSEQQWHSLFALAYPENSLAENTDPAAWPADLIRSDGPFYFLVAPHPDIKLKVHSTLPRDLLLAIALIGALIYCWKRRRAAH
jgi:hypothetical protein